MPRPVQKLSRGGRVFGKTLSAPIGGWNARDSLAAMKATDAVLADNVDIESGFIVSRPGYVLHATTVDAGNVETLFELWSPRSRELIAAMSTAIFNVSSASTSAVLLKGGFAGNGRWTGINFNGTALFVESSGADWPQETSDGSSVSSSTFTASAAGTLMRAMVHINVWKERVWLVETSSQNAYFGVVGGISGALEFFPVGRIGTFGGDLIGTYSWSIDAGDGPDDLLVFLFSSGDIAVYAGIDPLQVGDPAAGESAPLRIIGRYHIGEPLDRRAVIQVGGDLVIVSKQGYLPLSQVIREGQVAEETKALSEKIRDAVQAATETGKDSTGWEAMLHPRGTRLYFNVPTTKGSDPYHQHVFHTAAKAWSRYKKLPVRTLGKFKGEVYFGGTNGTVWRHTGGEDAGSAIQFDVQQAWSYFGDPARRKFIRTYEPLMEGRGSIAIQTAVLADFDRSAPDFQTGTITQPEQSLWDVALWDVAKWGSNENLVRHRFISAASGHALSIRLRADTTTAFRWYATSWSAEKGAVF